MTIDNTNETIEFVLGASVATSQASFSCVFDEQTASSLIPYETNGASNDTTAVALVSSPSSGNRRQVREMMFGNNDTAPITITVRYNNTSATRTVFKATLQIGEELSYNIETGWRVFDSSGLLELSTTHVQPLANMKTPELYINAGNSTSQLNAIAPMMSIGKAQKAYASISIQYRVTVAAVGTVWAELAVYRLCQPNLLGTQGVWYKLGHADTSAVWNSIGLKTTTVNVPGCRAGDDLYLVFAMNVSTTTVTFRGHALADVNSSNLNSILNGTSATAWRPSTQPIYQATAFSNAIASIILNWTGT